MKGGLLIRPSVTATQRWAYIKGTIISLGVNTSRPTGVIKYLIIDIDGTCDIMYRSSQAKPSYSYLTLPINSLDKKILKSKSLMVQLVVSSL